VEPAGPQQPIPDDIKLEVDIALGRPVSEADIACIADPVPLSCPSCGGVLSQLRKGSQLPFRCQVGHGYSAESLAVEQEPSVDEALRISLRILGERALLADKMATEARSTGRHAAAALSQKRARESRNYARVLEEAIRRKRDRETG
jgi:two-component system chemotaxis response regulator CheB